MFKKIALIVLFVGTTFGVAYLLYRFFFAPAAPSVTPPPTGTTGTVPGGLPTSGAGRPTTGGTVGPGGLPTPAPGTTTGAGAPMIVTPAPGEETPNLAAATVNADGSMTYYNRVDGRFYRILPDGSTQKLSDRVFSGVTDATWSGAGDKAVMTFPDESKIIYDFATQKQVTLPKHWKDFAFSADGGTLIAKSIGSDPQNRWLISTASDGSSAKLIEPLGENEAKVTVSVSPDASVVAFSETGDPAGFDTREILPIGQKGENLQALRVEGFGFKPEWSPNGSRLVYSAAGQAENYKPTLWVVSGQGASLGGGRTKLGINTWADKCTFSGNDTLYCAVPKSMPAAAGLQRDIVTGTPDSLYRIDLTTGVSRLVAQPSTAISVSTLTLSQDGRTLILAGSDGALQTVLLQ